MNGDQVYEELGRRLKYPGSAGLQKILRKILTPEEGKLLLELPASFEELASKLNRSEAAIESTIRSLWRRGAVMPTSKGFSFFDDIFGLWSSSVPSARDVRDPEMLKFWKEWYEDQWNYAMRNEWTSAQGPVLRVIPAWKSLEALRKVSPDQVLPEDDVRQLFEGRQAISLHECDCRLVIGNCCDHPMETCFQFDGMAEHHIGRGAAKRVTPAEAVSIIDSCEENGLVHIAFNRWPASRVLSLCNCCAKSCIVHDSGIRNRTFEGNVAKSRYQSTVDQQACTGCQTCIDYCNFDAITMEKLSGSKKLKAHVDPEKCWGCGVCTLTCESGALSMKLVRPQNVPQWGPSIYMDQASVKTHI